MSIIVGVLLASAAGFVGTVLRPPEARPREGRHLALAGAALLGAVLPPSARASEVLDGPATIIDGGNLVIADRRVRLYGVSAPDLDQTCWDARESVYPCGRTAAEALTRRVGEGPVTCEPREVSEDGAVTALCRVGNEDLGAWIVSQGYAVIGRQGPQPYAEIGARAWGRRLGMWSGVFQDPDSWRQTHRSKSPAQPPIAVPRTIRE